MGRHAESFLRGEGPAGGWGALLRLPLIPPAILFGELSALRRRLFRWKLLAATKLPCPVISVGNLTLGGTGKTPLVRTLAEDLLTRGERPLVLARGYGSRGRGDLLDEEGRALLRDLPGLLVAQGKNRLQALEPLLTRPESPTVIILDDGLQHLAIQRDLELITVDATCPFGSGWPLPAGILREWPGILAQADLIFVTRTNEVPPEVEKHLQWKLDRLAPGVPRALARHQAAGLLGEGCGLADLQGRRALLVSGIARPASFARLAASLGVDIMGHCQLPDHAPYNEARRDHLEEQAKRLGASLILATGKDEPKLGPLTKGRAMPWAFLQVSLKLDPAGEGTLARLLAGCLAGG